MLFIRVHLYCYRKINTSMLVATNKTDWLSAGCETLFSQRSLGKRLEYYP